MTDSWVTTAASAVQPGERVRLPSGDEMTATRVDRKFMGMDTMVAIIEDTAERWFKRPLPADAEVEVQRPATGPIADQPIRTLSGEPTTLAEHAGKALLVVNVASKCGLTPHYEGLQRVHERYADAGFTVLGFPCNQFGGQEPGTHEEIAELCSTTLLGDLPGLREDRRQRSPAPPDLRHADRGRRTPRAPPARCSGTSRSSSSHPTARSSRRFRPPTDPEAPELVAAIEGAPSRQET